MLIDKSPLEFLGKDIRKIVRVKAFKEFGKIVF
jgi:hypothetical protein